MSFALSIASGWVWAVSEHSHGPSFGKGDFTACPDNLGSKGYYRRFGGVTARNP
tara:strand:- start:915 stop:1076 length:162 start_codon:yes stop_codon:yes gene_type:complete